MKKRKGQWIAVGVMALTSLTLVQNVQAEEQASEVMDGETTIVEDAPRLEPLQEGVVEHSIEFENDILEDATTDAKSEVTTLMDESKELLTEVAPLKEQTESTDKSDDINVTTDESNIEKIVEPEATQAQPLDAVSTEVDDQTEEDSNKKADVIAVPTKTLGDTKLVPKPVVNPISEVKKHRITYGDTLWLIAKRYNVTLNNLRQWNKITGNVILPNQQIIVGKVAPKSPVEETKPTKPVEETEPKEKKEPTKETKPADQKTTTEIKQYTIVRGDTLNKIARAYGVSVAQLRQWNNISGHLIYPNQKIIVNKVAVTKPVETTTPTKPIEETKPTEKKEPTKETKPTDQKKTTEIKQYTIVRGDTLNKIAAQYGVTVSQLQQWNNISGHLIYPNQKIIVNKVAVTKPVETTTPTKPIEETKPTEKKEPTKETKPTDQKTTTEIKQYTIVRGDTLNKIAAQYGVTVSQLQQWNNISGHLIYPNQTIIVKQTTGNNKGDTTVVGGVNQAVQNVMNRYKGQSAYAYFESLTDGQTAGIYQNSLMYGASVPKVVLMAYTQDLIERGLLSWDTKWWYTDAIYNHPESYQWGGSGTIQYENFRSKPYTVREVLHRVGRDSDNLGSNMLLHYVGYRDKADFNRFTQKVYGAPKFSLTVTPKQMTEVVKYMNAQKERQAMTTLDKTIYDGTKLDVLPVNTYQKIGAWWPYYNHTTGIASGDKPFALTVLTNYWSDSKIGVFVKEIYNAFVK
ncbi:LysM peptidoglycan-binding domain-containing protein [Globicatella sulfidifaciens]|uniref:LysM peptidoglycan-binding domain-containing protein n=1 Tax=Globicatella sulfidifaciens TaxID=136093 RepID=UPI00288F1FBD|nr:LysM peptidoglycan-binding domain-containing protein [Globicatella sulfidifaciens]MDT2767686.1 LysM peptidoglycan-binding domain-containing protein [Globicatella sulfidifaciens]